MADALEVGDQGGQTGPDQAAFDDGQRGLEASGNGHHSGHGALGRQRGSLDIDLLDDVGAGRRCDAWPPQRTIVRWLKEGVDGSGGRLAFVLGVSGLATDLRLA